MESPEQIQKGAGYRAFYHSRSPADTMALGRALASCLHGGETILLYGTLGAGKTWFCHGLAEGLRVEGFVQSPTFTLMMEHQAADPGGLALIHFDAYRLGSSDDWYELGFSDYPGPREVAAVEWPERVSEALPADSIRLFIRRGEADDERFIRLEMAERPPAACLKKLEDIAVREEEIC